MATKAKKQKYSEQEIFKVTPKFKAVLDKAVQVKGVSKSLIIRTALEAWLDRNLPGWRK